MLFGIDVINARKKIKKKTLKTRFFIVKIKTFVNVIKTLPSILLAFDVGPID